MIEVKKQYCPQNHPCPVVRRCPVSAIVQRDNGAPIIDKEKCIDCGKCVKMCRVFAPVG